MSRLISENMRIAITRIINEDSVTKARNMYHSILQKKGVHESSPEYIHKMQGFLSEYKNGTSIKESIDSAESKFLEIQEELKDLAEGLKKIGDATSDVHKHVNKLFGPKQYGSMLKGTISHVEHHAEDGSSTVHIRHTQPQTKNVVSAIDHVREGNANEFNHAPGEVLHTKTKTMKDGYKSDPKSPSVDIHTKTHPLSGGWLHTEVHFKPSKVKLKEEEDLDEQTGDVHTKLSRLNKELLDIRQKEGIKKAVPGSRQHEIEQQIAKHKKSLGEDIDIDEGMMGLSSTSSHKQEADKHPIGSKMYYHHTGLHHESMAKIAAENGNHLKAREHRVAAGKYKALVSDMKEEVMESTKDPSPEWLKKHGMTLAQYHQHEYGSEKKPELKVGARVSITQGGHGNGTIHDLYKRKIVTGATKQFMHVKHDDGKEEHYRVDSTHHKVLKEEEIFLEAKPSKEGSPAMKLTTESPILDADTDQLPEPGDTEQEDLPSGISEEFNSHDQASTRKEYLDKKHPRTMHEVVQGRRSGKYFVVRKNQHGSHVAEAVCFPDLESGGATQTMKTYDDSTKAIGEDSKERRVNKIKSIIHSTTKE